MYKITEDNYLHYHRAFTKRLHGPTIPIDCTPQDPLPTCLSKGSSYLSDAANPALPRGADDDNVPRQREEKEEEILLNNSQIYTGIDGHVYARDDDCAIGHHLSQASDREVIEEEIVG